MVAALLDPTIDTPLYRQIHAGLRTEILAGRLAPGEKLPPTRDLAAQLNVNRATVAAAYALLEEEGLISGQVGRGSFVNPLPPPVHASALPEARDGEETAGAAEETISFATSRPSSELFPVNELRAIAEAVLAGSDARAILQLGSPLGYPALRHHLAETARQEGAARAGDDVLITSGCQQALDLLERVLLEPGDTVVVEDPVYPGLKNAFGRNGVRLVGVPVGPEGIDLGHLSRALEIERPKALVVTPNFQNPTGATLGLRAREALLDLATRARVTVIENDIYGQLRYQGEPAPTLKRLDPTGGVILLGSYSKVAFPGLRVGWVLAPRPLIERMAEAKQWMDLHSDQLSQAVMLEFDRSGRLAAHLARIRQAGRERLRTAIDACGRYLPPGTAFSRPQGGMSLWVELPRGLDAAELLPRARRHGVTYLPGRHFGVSQDTSHCLRLSFAGLEPERIARGIGILGRIAAEAREQPSQAWRYDAATAIV